jgi:acyl-CoA hydrolase
MDKHGYFNFSLYNSATRAMVEKAKTVIVEVNDKLPVCLGGREECIHISEVDLVVEGPNPELVELPRLAPTEVDKAIARLIVGQMRDGSTIQFGIGGMPDTIGRMLCESDLKDLGMHTEMLVDAYADLFEAGKLTNCCKNIDRGKGVFAFSVGSKRLYEWADCNPGLASYPVDYTNDPNIIAANDNVVAINNCVEVDLFGQINSESSGLRQISGTGGQLDFTTGAYMSRGGKAFVCMSSTYTDKKTGELNSRIVPTLGEGSIVTGPRSQSPYIVTEYGIANLHGRSTWERAERVIEIAHPQFRDELVREAQRMNVWRASNKL